MKIVLENSTGMLYHSHHDGHPMLSVTEGEACSLRCIAIGGYPPPEIELYIGKRDITDDFHLEEAAKMTGASGLRVMHYVTQRYTDGFIVEAEDDGNRLTCIAQVAGLKSNMSYVRLSVQCKRGGSGLPLISTRKLKSILYRLSFVSAYSHKSVPKSLMRNKQDV